MFKKNKTTNDAIAIYPKMIKQSDTYPEFVIFLVR
jgi:hypothetical protein